MKLFRTMLCVLFISCMLQGTLFGQQLNIKTHTLKNGLKVIVEEDKTIPNVALYIFYKIGSRNERPGTTGLSHFFEHMMFNGAKKYGPKEFDRVMEAGGGRNNAYTNRDLTVYQDWFPTSALELIFDMEADRIRDLSFDPKMIESEREVVASERRTSVDNNNFGIMDEQMFAGAYTAHPYQWPVLGWMSDIESWKMEDLKHHFAMGYSPSNAVMVVSGSVSAEEIFKLSEKYLESIPSHNPPPPVTTKEPEQLGEKRIDVRKFAQLPALMIGYHIPPIASPDMFSLKVLETVLFSGQSSRIYQRLIDKDQSAIAVGADFDFGFDPTLFVITTQAKSGVKTETVERAIYEELDKIKNDGVTDQELEKAKNILLAFNYRQLKTISGKANAIGLYEIYFGDYRKLLTASDDYNKVSKEDLRRVAQKYFSDKNRTVVTLIPEKEEASAKKIKE